MSNDTLFANLPLGAYLGATEVPLAQLSAGRGGITVEAASIVGPSAGTVVGGLLVTMTNVGTPVINGTIGTFTTPAITAAGVRAGVLAITDGYVAADEWIGFDQTSGTVPAGTFIALAYVAGK